MPSVNPPRTTPTGEITLFAKGVWLTSGWYDKNKSFGTGVFSMDSKLCWACTGSNMTQFGLDRYADAEC